jgi:hypothetical protein
MDLFDIDISWQNGTFYSASIDPEFFQQAPSFVPIVTAVRDQKGSPYDDSGPTYPVIEVNPSMSCCDHAGDADGSSGVDIDDIVYIINFIFVGGPEPLCWDEGNADCSGGIDIDDVVYLIAFVFSGGDPPCCP